MYELYDDAASEPVALHGLLALDSDTIIQVKAGNLQRFLELISMGYPEPGLDLVDVSEYVDYERYRAENCFAEIQWNRLDVLDAIEGLYGIRLEAGSDEVEALVESIVEDIGRDLQDRSIEHGFEVIYRHLPKEEELKVFSDASRKADARLAGSIAGAGKSLADGSSAARKL